MNPSSSTGRPRCSSSTSPISNAPVINRHTSIPIIIDKYGDPSILIDIPFKVAADLRVALAFDYDRRQREIQAKKFNEQKTEEFYETLRIALNTLTKQYSEQQKVIEQLNDNFNTQSNQIQQLKKSKNKVVKQLKVQKINKENEFVNKHFTLMQGWYWKKPARTIGFFAFTALQTMIVIRTWNSTDETEKVQNIRDAAIAGLGTVISIHSVIQSYNDWSSCMEYALSKSNEEYREILRTKFRKQELDQLNCSSAINQLCSHVQQQSNGEKAKNILCHVIDVLEPKND